MPGDHMTQSRSPAFSRFATPCGFLMTPTFLFHVLPLPMGGTRVRFACVFPCFGGLTEQWGYVPRSFEVTALVETTYRTRLYGSVALPTVYPAITARRSATVDHIARGRLGIDLVLGCQAA